jgi:Ca2+-binding RTX toxin-like protein
MDLSVSLELENTLQGLQVSEADGGSDIGSPTFDAVLIEDRLQDREVLTRDDFIAFDLDLDARAALEDSGVIGTPEVARDAAQVRADAAVARLARERDEAEAAADALADTAESWALTAANDIAGTFAIATSAAASAVNAVSDAAKSGLATTQSDVIESLNGRITFLLAQRDVPLARSATAGKVYLELLQLYEFTGNNGIFEKPLRASVTGAVNTLIERGDLRGVNVGSSSNDYGDIWVTIGEIQRYRHGAVEEAQILNNRTSAAIEARNRLIDEYNSLSIFEKAIFGFADFINGVIEGGLDALTTTVTGIDRLAQGTAQEARSALDAKGATATLGDVLVDLGEVIAEGAEAAAAFAAAGVESTNPSVLDGALMGAIGDGNRLTFDLAIDAAALAQAGIVIDLRFDGGSVASNLDYALTSIPTYDPAADSFNIAPTAADATTGEQVAFTTISLNAQFYLGLAYFADVTLDIVAEYFGRAIGYDLFDGEGPIETTEYVSIGGILDVVEFDTANLDEAGILPDMPLAAFQFPDIVDNRVAITFGNWVDQVVTEPSFGIPILETEGRQAEFSPDFYADEVNVLQNLRTILSDFADTQLGFPDEFQAILAANGAPTEFGEADFFQVIEAVFDSITAVGEIEDDFLPNMELSIGSETALFHIDTLENDLAGLDLSHVGSLGFFTASDMSNEVAKIVIDVDTLATVVVGQAVGIAPEAAVKLNLLDLGRNLEDELAGTDLIPDQQAVVNSAVALGVGLDIADVKIDSGRQFDQKFAPRIDDMGYEVAFADGTTQRMRATDAEVLVSEDAGSLEDVNGDGAIDYTLTLTPASEFCNDTELKLALGYTLDILKANLQLGLSLPLSQIPNLGLTDVEVSDLDLALGPLFRASADIVLLTLDVFEDRFAYEAGSAAVAGSVAFPPTGRGSSGRDDLNGSEGDDVLLGFAGSDDLEGGVGDDTYLWGERRDRVVEAAGGGTDRIEATAHVALRGAEVETVELLGGGDHRVVGSGTAQTILGHAGANLLAGGGGDTVTGGEGADIFAFRVDDAPGLTVITDLEPGDRIALDERFFGLGTDEIAARDVTEAQFRGALRAGLVEYGSATGILRIDADGRDGAEAPVEILQVEGGAPWA